MSAINNVHFASDVFIRFYRYFVCIVLVFVLDIQIKFSRKMDTNGESCKLFLMPTLVENSQREMIVHIETVLDYLVRLDFTANLMCSFIKF